MGGCAGGPADRQVDALTNPGPAALDSWLSVPRGRRLTAATREQQAGTFEPRQHERLEDDPPVPIEPDDAVRALPAPRTFWAPGRVNLIGEHTDYSGGLVLPVALDRGITLSVTGVGGAMRVTSSDGDAQRFAEAVMAELAARGLAVAGLEAVVSTTLPIGAGLSSSAALGVALGLALTTLSDERLGALELAEVVQHAETRATGVPCGIMDQAASILGRPGHGVLLDTGSFRWEHVPLPTDHAIVVVDSGVRRRLEDSAYAARREELERGLAGASDPVARRRVRHVESENGRVREVAAILRSSPVDTMRLGAVFREAHESLRVDFEVSTTELDELVELAYALGATAARMTGAGFGGSMVTLVPVADAPSFTDEIVAAYGGNATAWIGAAAGGACELTTGRTER